MTGHENLIWDLVTLLKAVTRYEFHDYKCDAATPKVNLVMKLNEISDNVKSGKYDDVADEQDIDELRKVCERENMPDEIMKMLGLK